MQYKKFICGETVIELHNSWLGEETVKANGQVVSKKSSVWGTSHFFTVLEDGHTARYALITKLNDMMQVVVDITRNGELLHDNVPIPWASLQFAPRNKQKKKGLQLLQEYDLEDALAELEQARMVDPKDAEIHFHMACAYSVMERKNEGFEALKTAVAKGLANSDAIFEHDMLAYLRLQPEFERFVASGFKQW